MHRKKTVSLLPLAATQKHQIYGNEKTLKEKASEILTLNYFVF